MALSSDGNTALIGGYADGGEAGAVWSFTRSGSTWAQQGSKLTGSLGEIGAGDFGIGVALSSDGTTVLVGAISDNSLAGDAWVFTSGIPGIKGTTGGKGASGLKGSTGLQGATGSVGPTGSLSSTGYERLTNTASGTDTVVASVSCTSGKKVIGGGASAGGTGASLVTNYPPDTSSWTGSATTSVSGGAVSVSVYAICTN